MATSTLSEADIFTDIVAPGKATLTPEAAQSLLDLKFTAKATQRIRRLLQKNNRGTISAPERDALAMYLRAGELLDLLHAKAKLSLKQNGAAR